MDPNTTRLEILTRDFNKAISRHLKKGGDAHDVVTATLGVLTATVKSIRDPVHREHYANQVIQKVAETALTTGLN